MFAEVAFVGGVSLVQMLIGLIILIAIAAIVFRAAKELEMPLPGVLVSIFWICVVAAVAILGIRFLLSL